MFDKISQIFVWFIVYFDLILQISPQFLLLTLNFFDPYSGQDTSPGSQLQLTLLWDRPDLASKFILSKPIKWKVRNIKTCSKNI